MTYIDEYTIQTIGSKWHKGKEKKNQILTETKSTDGTALKKLARFLVLSLDYDNPKKSYVGVALNKEHALPWISHMKRLLGKY